MRTLPTPTPRLPTASWHQLGSFLSGTSRKVRLFALNCSPSTTVCPQLLFAVNCLPSTHPRWDLDGRRVQGLCHVVLLFKGYERGGCPRGLQGGAGCEGIVLQGPPAQLLPPDAAQRVRRGGAEARRCVCAGPGRCVLFAFLSTVCPQLSAFLNCLPSTNRTCQECLSAA